MRSVTLDFAWCGTETEVHQYLKTSFGFPDYYGENLDALYDCLTEIAEDTEIVLKGNTETCCPAFGEGMQRFLKIVRQVIEDAAEENSHLFL